jgi:hypothetical protein
MHEDVVAKVTRHIHLTQHYVMLSRSWIETGNIHPNSVMPQSIKDAYFAARDSRVDVDMALSRGTFLAPEDFTLATAGLQAATPVLELGASEDDMEAWRAEIRDRLQAWVETLTEWVRSLEDPAPAVGA